MGLIHSKAELRRKKERKKERGSFSSPATYSTYERMKKGTISKQFLEVIGKKEEKKKTGEGRREINMESETEKEEKGGMAEEKDLEGEKGN